MGIREPRDRVALTYLEGAFGSGGKISDKEGPEAIYFIKKRIVAAIERDEGKRVTSCLKRG